MDTVRLLVDIGPSGRPVREDVPARPEGDGWRLLASPGLALGAAAGDLVKVHDDSSFEVLDRGGNVAVHVSAAAEAQDSVARLRSAMEALGGWCDGTGWTNDRRSSLTVFTVPVTAGFPAIQQALTDYQNAVPTGEWYYVNVYDPTDDTTPLNWWLD